MAEDKRTQLRIPDDLYQWVRECSEKSERSMNGQIIYMLRKAKEGGETEQAAFERGRQAGIQQAMNP